MIQEMITFKLPDALNASAPPERRGVRRDHVRLLVLDRVSGRTHHVQFNQLPNFLKAGDVLVLNSSRTIPAILKAVLSRFSDVINHDVEVRLARRQNDSKWEALIVEEGVKEGDSLHFNDGLEGMVTYTSDSSPLATIQFSKKGTELLNHFYSIGEPVRYEYINQMWGLDYYQTVFAAQPGSVEMPSAGRAFSWELLFELQRRGVKIVYLQHHTGLSYFLDDKWNHSPEDNFEEYNIPENAWETILEAKESGNKVIAVGTTVVRAMETAVISGTLSGWTNLYIQPDSKLKVADAILTGLHEPEASHLSMLSAFVHQGILNQAYQEAIDKGYLWHEFGDMNLII
ncbi:MAG: S-adenosylmethionine:tRNA ribosyltransferase-isomerase [Bacillota bacterium]|nr:S-adenosylmethionine:tRNA ribosyltransferase-isomerase [Bacillota bacterium]